MVGAYVRVLDCSKSFGNPSGHASLTATFYTALFLLAFHDQELISKKRESLLNVHPAEERKSDRNNS